MATESFNLIPRRSKVTNKVINGQFVTAIPDISMLGYTIQKIAASEIKEEIRQDNPPQNIVVDNQDSKPFTKAKFRITTYFANTDDMAKAALTVIQELKKVTPVLTGKAQNSFYIYTSKTFKDGGTLVYKGTPGLTTLKNIAATIKGKQGRLIVAGPMVDYGRKLYWRPRSTRKLKGRVTKVPAYDAGSGKTSNLTGRRDTNMRDLVVGRARRKNKGVVIVGRWIRGKIVNGDSRWPGIAIGLKSKGRLR